MAGSLTVGDVVQLRSGGPSMTITEVDRSYGAFCTWFKSTNEVAGQYFPLEALKPSDGAK